MDIRNLNQVNGEAQQHVVHVVYVVPSEDRHHLETNVCALCSML